MHSPMHHRVGYARPPYGPYALLMHEDVRKDMRSCPCTIIQPVCKGCCARAGLCKDTRSSPMVLVMRAALRPLGAPGAS